MNLRELQTEAQPMYASFDEALKLRGKARKPAIAQWLVDNEDHRLSVLYRLLNEKSASRKNLGQEYMIKLVPTAREQDAYVEMLSGFIHGGKPTLHAMVFDLLKGKPAQGASLFGAVCDYLRYARNERTALVALDLLAEVLDSEHAPDPEKSATMLDPVLDHWSQQISEKTAELIVLQGGQPRASMWAGCPLSGELRRQLGRVGAKVSGTPDPKADRSISDWENHAQLDTSSVQQVPWPIAYIQRHVSFPSTLAFFDPDEGEFSGGSELYYAIEENGSQFFLYDILYHDAQYYITLDLTDTSDDPKVYGYDHEGWMRGSEGSLSRFLSRLTGR